MQLACFQEGSLDLQLGCRSTCWRRAHLFCTTPKCVGGWTKDCRVALCSNDTGKCWQPGQIERDHAHSHTHLALEQRIQRAQLRDGGLLLHAHALQIYRFRGAQACALPEHCVLIVQILNLRRWAELLQALITMKLQVSACNPQILPLPRLANSPAATICPCGSGSHMSMWEWPFSSGEKLVRCPLHQLSLSGPNKRTLNSAALEMLPSCTQAPNTAPVTS
eukprot:1140840-Pelagomonas_calceolata.AAC.12